MARPIQHTVLVTVLEGRHFLRKPNSKLYVQCRFNNEILTTDPVDHNSNPIYDTELAWDIDTKALGFFRSQRASLKLIVYSVDALNKRDMIGFIMLDLRAAPPDGKQQDKWYPLVNAKYSGAFRPEIKVLFGIVPKKEPNTDEEAYLNRTRPNAKPKIRENKDAKGGRVLGRDRVASGGYLRKSLPLAPTTFSIPVNLTDSGYYQIGHGQILWVLEITVAFAENLQLLADKPLPPSDAGFYFYFSFLGNDITTEKFAQLDNPDFPAERVSIRIRASGIDLRQFIEELSHLIIYLCREEQVLGFADISVRAMVPDVPDDRKGSEGFMVIEKMHNMYSMKQELPMSSDGKVPSIGVSLSMTVEEGEQAGEQEGKTHSIPIGGEHTQEDLREDTMVMRPPPIPAPTPQDDHNPSMSILSAVIAPLQDNPSQLKPDRMRPTPSPARINSTSEVPIAHELAKDVPSPWHQYRFSIDLRSIREFSQKSGSIYLKYSYHPFGSVSPFITHPPLSISRTNNEILFPHSFCAFEFVMSPDRLQTYLEAVPLVVELWSKDPFTKDVILGSATVDMGQVWKRPKEEEEISIGANVGAKAMIQSVDKWVIIASEGEGRLGKIADLRVVLALEDFGEVDDGEIERATNGEQARAQIDRTTSRPPLGISAAGAPSNAPIPNRQYIYPPHVPPSVGASSLSVGSTPGSTPLHSTPEYKIALELELWRAEEERKFRAHMRARETELLEQLASEWKNREREREATIKRKVDEFKNLEQKLQNLATDLERRERQLRDSEADFTRRKEEIERDARRVVEEARDGARRLHEEYKHRLQVEKGRVTEMERQRDQVGKERQDLASQVALLQQQLAETRSQAASTPEAKLKDRVTELERSITAFEAKVENEKRAKKYYKQQWVKTLKELAKCKKGWQTEVEARLERERRELERMKIDGGREVLEEIRRELEELKLRTSVNNAPRTSQNKLGQGAGKESAEQDGYNPQVLVEVERLAKERDSLLSSGVYTREDRLVRELERRIRELLGGGET